MNGIKVFTNKEFGEMRTVEIENEPWFVGKDVAEKLGYLKPSNAILRHVDSEDKQFLMIDIADPQNGDVPKGQTRTAIINESGLYSLILSSKLPDAKKFKKWVTSEVIPAIRKHGAYMTPETIEKTLTNPDFIIQLATQLKEEQVLRKQAEEKMLELIPHAELGKAIESTPDSIAVGDFAKILQQNGIANLGRNKLYAWFRENGYLIKQKGDEWNSPTQKSMRLGLFEVYEYRTERYDGVVDLTCTAKITGKGQSYFLNVIKNKNIVAI